MGDFLVRHSPQLAIVVYSCGQFPPLHILNEELMSGGRDLGMSGGCFWKPFELSAQEYDELRDGIITNPAHSISYDDALEDRQTLKKWVGAVFTKHNRRKRSD